MITYTHPDKTQKDQWLPRLFDLYYLNMSPIAPSGLSYEEERSQWLSAVSPALDKAPRQILLCCKDDELAGYVQYYTREDLLMIEEVQISPDCQHSSVFRSLIRALIRLLPDGVRYVEAYADCRNRRSISLMERLGMTQLPQQEGPRFVHLRGCAGEMQCKFLR